jgi:hypothetical protein
MSYRSGITNGASFIIGDVAHAERDVFRMVCTDVDTFVTAASDSVYCTALDAVSDANDVVEVSRGITRNFYAVTKTNGASAENFADAISNDASDATDTVAGDNAGHDSNFYCDSFLVTGTE